MMLFSAAIVVLGIVYSAVLVRLANGFRAAIAAWRPGVPHPLPSVSVLIAARNEARDITRCVRSILENDYPEELVDVHVADDASEDETADIVATLAAESNRLHLIRLPEVASEKSGKRAALETAIAKSNGDLILLTDADSEAPPTWIRTMVSAFDRETRFVSGPVAYRSSSGALHRLLELELLGLVAAGAGAITHGRPNMCNGANIGFRRSAFDEIGGYAGTDESTSGDDELLMQKMSRKHPGSVAFCPDRAALVTTVAPKGLRALFNQRRRWASKGLHYPDKGITLLAILVYAFNLTLAVGVVTAFLSPGVVPALLSAFAVKLAAEGWLFWNVCDHFGRRHLLPRMFDGQLFEIPYVVVIGAAGIAGRYPWKGRKIRR